ncbi:molybdenum cofactor guanylyltransferase [Sphingomonas sp. Sphisp140]|uniref:molybdenum cofactor guanylyltransferase n=1 Tax=unclassified Sphingomonas TaxID=196159 RepID=UPI0039AEF95D
MRILGAVLAGGRSSRFGSDKALAVLEGKPLIAHAIEALAAHADTVVSCGRDWPGLVSIPDNPAGGHGPLAGLNAALRHAAENGFDTVLCAPIDVHPLPDALRLLAGESPAVLRTQWAVGHWPAALGPALDRHLASGALSIRSWLQASEARLIDDAHLGLRNINFVKDLPVPLAPGE